MHAAKILASATAALPYRYGTAEIAPYIERWLADDPALAEKALRIVAATQIERRAAAIPIDDVFRPRRFEERNRAYMEAAVDLGEAALRNALAAAAVEPAAIDLIVTVSCTGYMIPSVDAYLVNRLGLRQDVQRLPVLQMGCAGGTAALIYAADYLEAHPGSTAAVVSIELPSLTLRLDDRSMPNVVSTAIFGDGVAAVVLGPGTGLRPAMGGRRMYHFADSTALMGYVLRDSGFQIVLDRDVPAQIESHFDAIVFPFLAACGVALEDVRWCIFHPGSIKILDAAARLLASHGKDVDASRAVLREHGNMSSATILYILDRILGRPAAAGDRALLLAFGPGFTAHTILLRWA